MYCSHCGKPINKDDKYCQYCGKENKYYNSDNIEADLNSYLDSENGYYNAPTHSEEPQALGVCAIIFSSLGGLLGLVLAIVGLSKYKEKPGRTKCKIALIILAVWFFIGIMIGCNM